MMAFTACAQGAGRGGNDDYDDRPIDFEDGSPNDPGSATCSGWPGGTTGVGVGMTVPASLSWQGYAPGSSQPTTIAIQDLYDCDGTRGIDAILIETAQYGCSACSEQASGLNVQMQSWSAQGLNILVLTLLLDDQSEAPATAASALTWRQAWGLNDAYVAADPGFSMVPGNDVGTPQMTVVDPRTMQVVALEEGWGGYYPPQLEQLAHGNRTP